MNWMRVLAAGLTIAALCFWQPAAVRAQSAPPQLAPIPDLSPENPYAKMLPEARQQASDALAKLNDVIANDPFNFDAQIQAYYTYAGAQARYDLLLQMARAWEKQTKGSFTGKVLSFDTDAPIPLRDGPSAAPQPVSTADAVERHVDPSMMRRTVPVAEAKITLRPVRIPNPGRPHPQPRPRPVAGGAEPNPQTSLPLWLGKFYTATTLKDGSFKFEQQIPPGNYSMVVTKEGFETWHGNVEVPKSGPVERVVYLSKFKMLMGLVQTVPLVDLPKLQAVQGAQASADGTASAIIAPPPETKLLPVEGALVTLTMDSTIKILFMTVKPSQVKYEAKTGPKGDYEIKGIRAGRYHLRAEKEGLRPFEGTLFVSGISQHQNIVLLPSMPLPAPNPGPVPVRIEHQMNNPSGSTLDRPFDNR